MKVGAIKLSAYLKKNQIKPSHMARELGKFPSTFSRIISGHNCPDLQTATDIEVFTKGAVLRDDWLQESPIKKIRDVQATSGAINRK